MAVRKSAVITLITLWSPLASACNVVNGEAYGDCNQVNVKTIKDEALIISSSRSESGIISSAIIKRGGLLKLSGISVGDITVEAGGLLEISGQVNGSIINNGGKVKVNGIVRVIRMNGGAVDISGVVESVSGSGLVTYQKGAVIGGRPVK
jgi:autotransporter passenger strand-loop-strand repeat protein